MSTTVELVRANERYARLRAAVEALAAEWEGWAKIHDEHTPVSTFGQGECFGEENSCTEHANSLRALLAAVDS